MAIAGLLLIVAGWAYQVLTAGKLIKSPFVLMYAAGAFCLTLLGFIGKDYLSAVLNLASVLLALAVLLKKK